MCLMTQLLSTALEHVGCVVPVVSFVGVGAELAPPKEVRVVQRAPPSPVLGPADGDAASCSVLRPLVVMVPASCSVGCFWSPVHPFIFAMRDSLSRCARVHRSRSQPHEMLPSLALSPPNLS